MLSAIANKSRESAELVRRVSNVSVIVAEKTIIAKSLQIVSGERLLTINTYHERRRLN